VLLDQHSSNVADFMLIGDSHRAGAEQGFQKDLGQMRGRRDPAWQRLPIPRCAVELWRARARRSLC
jgi:hypothetical protein